MRELKFRAWDKENKEMESFDSFYELQKSCKTHEELKNMVFMQFTGLKDKNGKEIFEGDIVTDDLDTLSVIEWVDIKYVRRILNKKSYYCTDGNDLRIAEIIGNIHENPELLKIYTHDKKA